jgi:hypothetical protein
LLSGFVVYLINYGTDCSVLETGFEFIALLQLGDVTNCAPILQRDAIASLQQPVGVQTDKPLAEKVKQMAFVCEFTVKNGLHVILQDNQPMTLVLKAISD